MFESWRTDIGETSSGDLRNRVDVDARNNFWNCAISKTAHPPQHGIKRTLSKNLLLDGFEGANFQLPFYNEKGREKSNRKRRSEQCVAVKSAIPNFDRNMPLYVIQCRVPRVSMSRISPTFLCIARRKEGGQFALDLSSYLQRIRLEPDIPSIQFLGRITQLRVGKKGRRYRDWEIILFWRKEIDSYESQFRGIIYLGTVGNTADRILWNDLFLRQIFVFSNGLFNRWSSFWRAKCESDGQNGFFKRNYFSKFFKTRRK